MAYAGTRMILSLAFPECAEAADCRRAHRCRCWDLRFCCRWSTGVVFGIVPAWITSHSDPAEALRGVNRSTRDRASLPQKSLIVLQAALSLVMLVGAGLLTKSLRNMEHQDFGLQTENRYVLHLFPAGAGYTPEKLPALYQQLEQQFGCATGSAERGDGAVQHTRGKQLGRGGVCGWPAGTGAERSYRLVVGPGESTISSRRWDSR